MKIRNIIRNNTQLIKYVVKYAPLYSILGIITKLLYTADALIVNAILVRFILNALANRVSIGRIYMVLALVAVFKVAYYLSQAVCDEYLKPKAKLVVYENMQSELAKKAVGVDLECYDNTEYYNDFILSIKQAEEKAMEVYDTLANLLSHMFMFVGFAVFITYLKPIMLIPIVIFFVCNLLINGKKVKINYEKNIEAIPLKRKRDYTKRVFYLKEYANDVRLTNISVPIIRNFRESIKKIKDIYIKHGIKLMAWELIAEIVCTSIILNVGTYVYLIYELVVKKSILVGDFMSLGIATENIIWRMNDFISTLPKFAEHSLYIEKLNSFLQYENKIRSGNRRCEGIGDIDIRNLSFGYDSELLILKNISLRIRKGEKIAIVGSNGAGKTTFVKLLLRLYDPTGGEIYINDVSLKEYHIDSIHAKVATVFQDFNVYAMSIKDNIAMLDGECDFEMMDEALGQSGLVDKVESLEQGVDTELTNEFDERGTSLSGGETQKLAMARAVYKNSDLLILDEPQSKLDPISEYNFNKTMQDIAADKTVVFVSHRLSTTVAADRIIVLEDGRIIEMGSHEVLLSREGVYYKMWNSQNYAVD